LVLQQGSSAKAGKPDYRNPPLRCERRRLVKSLYIIIGKGMVVKRLDNQHLSGTVSAILLCLNTQMPKMPHLAILGNTIRLVALHNCFSGLVLTEPTSF
jgi:hypothetical protein